MTCFQLPSNSKEDNINFVTSHVFILYMDLNLFNLSFHWTIYFSHLKVWKYITCPNNYYTWKLIWPNIDEKCDLFLFPFLQLDQIFLPLNSCTYFWKMLHILLYDKLSICTYFGLLYWNLVICIWTNIRHRQKYTDNYEYLSMVYYRNENTTSN